MDLLSGVVKGVSPGRVLRIAAVVGVLAMPALARAGVRPISPHSATKGVALPQQTRVGSTARTRGTAGTAPTHVGQLSYHGGAWMQSSVVVGVYWRPSGWTGGTISLGFKSLVDGYLANVAADHGKTGNVFSVGDQYGVGYGVTYGGSLVDTDPLPSNPEGCNHPAFSQDVSGTCLSNGDVENELYDFLTAHGLPGDSGEGPTHPTRMYVFFLPPGVNDCFFDYDPNTGLPVAPRYCSALASRDAYFCAYHRAFTWIPDAEWPDGDGDTEFDSDNDGDATYNYANMPYVWGYGGCQEGQSPNGNVEADAAVSVTSHEFMESMTDPYGDGWYDAAGYEIADKCDRVYGSTLGTLASGSFNQLVGTGHYWTQLEYSNALNGCYQLGPPTVDAFHNGGATRTVQISGTNLWGPVVVSFNGVVSPSVTVDSPTSIHAVVPTGNTAGLVTIQALGGQGTSSQTFTYPTVTGLASARAYAGSTITVNGAGFAGVQSVKFNGIAATFSNVASDGTSLQAVVPANAVDGDVTVTAALGSSTDHVGFGVLPRVTGMAPRTSYAGQTLTMTGSGLAGATSVRFTGGASAPIMAKDANDLTVTVPSGARTGPLVVTSSNGSATSPGFKLIPKPTPPPRSNPWPRGH